MNEIGQKNRVLFVDDEPRITSALRATFRRDFNVVVANSGDEALRILEKHQIDVIVSDQRMPGMLGHELLARVSRMYPQTMRILLTGFTDMKAIVESINDGEIFRFVNKPWQNEEMRKILHEAALASKELIPISESEIAQNLEESSFLEFNDSVNVIDDDLVKVTKDQPVKKLKPLSSSKKAMLMLDQKKSTRLQVRRYCNTNKIMIYGTKNPDQAVAAAVAREQIGVAVLEFSHDNQAAIDTINVIKRVRPETVTVALTDELDAETAVDLINQGQVFKYLAKPFNGMELEDAIQNAFIRHEFLKNNKVARKRFSVEKPKRALSRGLQNILDRLLK